MKTSRLEAFSDGVIAVIITIMVLALKVPHSGTLEALRAVIPSLLVYGLSFAVVAIIWVNHHHVIEKARWANAALLWSNNLLLFWMSLIPFATAYLSGNSKAPLAVGVYGLVFVLTCISSLLLQAVLTKQNSNDAAKKREFRLLNGKTVLSIACYLVSVGMAFVSIYVSYAIFVIIPLTYLWPERKGSVRV